MSKKRKKGVYSERFNEDYQFYTDNKDKFTFCGQELRVCVLEEKGVDAKEAFYIYDTHGSIAGCKEPEAFRDIIRCKKSINWQIKQWVEGFYCMCEPFSYYTKEFINPPYWVEESLKKAVWKRWDVGMTEQEKEIYIEFWLRIYQKRNEKT